MSETLRKLIQNKKGYRTESYSGSGVRNPSEVIEFEICELGNTDIISFVQNHYNLLKEYDAFGDLYPFQENIHEIIKEILDYCCQALETKDLEAIWLTTYEYVQYFYNDNREEDIDEYPIKDYVVLSDLDRDGILFVFKKNI